MIRRAFLQTGAPTVSRRNSRFLTVALMLWIGFGALGQAEAGVVLATPAGLKPGDQFRIVFATDGTTMATSTTITDYDNFVTNQAQGATYNGQTVQWKAIVSVEFTNAIDYIGQIDTPIYLANGTQVTTSTTASGLWSGALESPIFTDLNGQLVHGQVWTGTNADGVAVPGHALGDSDAIVGSNMVISAGWIETDTVSFTESHILYGISQVLTVALTQQPVPEPSSIVMLGTALLAAAYTRRFRNAKFTRTSRNPPSGHSLNGSTEMMRRDLLKTGVGGTGLALAGGVARADGIPAAGRSAPGAQAADANIVVVGADGSVPSKPIVDKYIAAAADVWFYLPNLPEFSADLEFLDSDPRIKLAKSVADIRAHKQAGKVSMVIGWQNSAALEEGPGNDWRNSRPPRTKLREYYELGLRVANLSYSLSNQFGGGMLDPKAPLTTQGKFLIGKMQDMGILVDCCGHTSEQTALDIIAMARRPVVITHGNVLALNDNPRNSSDRVIEGVARTGGLMGVTALDAFMTWSRKDAARVDTGPYPPRANVARYVDEFDYLKRLVGIDHIAIGSDFTSDVEAADPTQLFQFPPEMMYKQPTIKYVAGFESVSDLKNVRAEMVRRGYTPEEIAKVFGGNWMRVFREAWNS